MEPDRKPADAPERGVVVAVLPHGADPDAALAEMRELLRTAGVEACASVVQHRDAPDPRTYLGPGKLAELERIARELEAEVVVCDDELLPRQQRRLEDALELRVVDRTAVILDIFAQHAHTSEGKLQVELAQLEYNLQRMRGMWKHLERLGGGIGTRGPGESQLESDRRMARRRITLLRARLRRVASRRELMRRERERNDMPTVALAGYTNVGKSTLLNALTGAGVSVNDRLFETLDPTTRAFREDGRAYLVTDTVGFIRRLPHGLVEAFAATLEETLSGDLLLLVADASAAEEELADQLANVGAVLAEIGAEELPRVLVLNKIDAVDALTRRRLANRHPDAVQISARTGENLDALKARVAAFFARRFVDVRLLVPHGDGAVLSDLYQSGAPITAREDRADGVLLTARLPRGMLARFGAYALDGRAAAELPGA
jgi:GTPase